MKVIFLDFDGVINPITFHQSAAGFSNAACSYIQSILTKEASARIVISSAWRRNGLDYCRKLLKENGIDDTRVIGVTDGEGGWAPENRGAQIVRWLNSHKEVTRYVIFDDYPLIEFKKNYIKVNSYVGLTEQEAQKAISILCG